MALSLSQSANQAAKVYFQVARVLDHPAFPEAEGVMLAGERDDYMLRFHDYDIWSECPEDWEEENGFRPPYPLTPERRKVLKGHGFQFKRDLTVLYKGVPCDEWTVRQGTF